MKKIVVWCNGTWNKASSDHPTNVQIGAQALLPASDNVLQMNIYLEGVGTSYLLNEWIETRLAGAFGLGLFDKVAEAYRHIVFNYEPGDEIYIFGFSRGAYTARSLAGLMRKCGIIEKANSKSIQKAFRFYKDGGVHPDSDEAQKFRMVHSPSVVLKNRDRDWQIENGREETSASEVPLLCVKYLGVWDTVGALGVPQHLLISRLANTMEKYAFHDTDLSSTIFAARHAVAIDEDRLSFEPALWSNLSKLNSRFEEKRYLQEWFPGDHGSVGGGGDITGLSNNALRWVLQGAIDQGLSFDFTQLTEIFGSTDFLAPLSNQSSPKGLVEKMYRRGPRKGPANEGELSEFTLQRLEFERKSKDHTAYRPKALRNIHLDKKLFRRSGGEGW